jgi:hypothetical protein
MPRQLPGAIDARVRKQQNNNPKSQTNSEPTKSRLQREGIYTSGKGTRTQSESKFSDKISPINFP